MRRILFVLLLLGAALQLQAQISFRNQLVYTHWKKEQRNILEDWADVTWQHNWFKAGLRYEINHPPDPYIFPKDSLLKNYELTFRYLQFAYHKMHLTVGNFYEMFGRGLTLRTYEDRNLRVDTNIEGVRFHLAQKKFKFKAFAGRMRDKYNRRDDFINGYDAELRPRRDLQVGASLLYNSRSGQKTQHVWSGRVNYSHDRGDVYFEAVRPQWTPAYSYYAAANFAFERLAVTAEIKDYNHMSFKNGYETEYNAAPSVTREHVFSLLNRHPHALNQDDERGYQLEASYNFNDDMQLLANHSQTFTHDRKRIFAEYYLEWNHFLGDKIEYHVAADWNYDFSTNTENVTPLVDGAFNLSERDQLHVSVQHQHTKNRLDLSEYDNEFLLLEYSRSPLLSAAIVSEYTNKDQLRNVQMERHFWIYGTMSFNFWKNQRLSLLYGTRREGFICVGGVCRYEPEFEGIEIKLTNRF